MTYRGSLAACVIGSLAASAVAAHSAKDEKLVASLIAVSERSNAALMRGDAETWSKLVKLSPDFSLMSPFGGAPSFGPEYTPDRVMRMGKFFRNGNFKMEVVESYATRDMVVLALIEHSNVEVGAMPAQDWALRVTLVYRRAGSQWELVHRHADPLVAPVDLVQAAALARGERAVKGTS